VAGEACILADHDTVTIFAALKHQPRRLTDLQRELRRDHAVSAAANAIGAKILSSHIAPVNQIPLRALPKRRASPGRLPYKVQAIETVSKNMMHHYAGKAINAYKP